MIQWLRSVLMLDAKEAVQLGPGEEILHEIGRHWIVLLTRLILPGIALLTFVGLALYRAAGGTFLVRTADEQVGLDLFNWLLVIAVVAITLAWFALYVRGKKTQNTRSALIAIGLVLLGLVWFRFNGGRLFFLDPDLYSGQGTDLLNWALIGLSLISLFLVWITFYDWLNDELILTNQRVVYDNDMVFIPRLLEQRVQEQIFLEDIQGVDYKTVTYPQHVLKYGTITVRSARIGGNIAFESAAGAEEMQKRIMDQVRALQKRMSTENYDRLIEERVYGVKTPKKKFDLRVKQSQGVLRVNWLVPANPEFNEDNGTYTWRAHWLFQLLALVDSFVLLTVGMIGVAVAQRIFALESLATAGLIVLVLLAFIARAAWKNEDYNNDKYILSPTNVVDIEKLPFGPEDRRQSSLSSITNVSFKTTFISNLIGYGDVILETAGAGGKFTFDNVPRPNDVVSVINDYIVNFKRDEKARSLNDTLELLSRYHEAQKRHNELNTPPASAP